MRKFLSECIAFVVFRLPLNTLSNAHLMTISVFDILVVECGKVVRMPLRYNAPFVSFKCLKVRWFEWYFRIRIQNHIYFENTTNFFYPRYVVSKKESVISEIRYVFPWCFEKYTPEKYPRYKKRPKVVFYRRCWKSGAWFCQHLIFELEIIIL